MRDSIDLADEFADRAMKKFVDAGCFTEQERRTLRLTYMDGYAQGVVQEMRQTSVRRGSAFLAGCVLTTFFWGMVLLFARVINW